MRHPPGTEAHARSRLTYWQRRIEASERGADSRDPYFVALAYRMRDMWAGKVTQLELETWRRAA